MKAPRLEIAPFRGIRYNVEKVDLTAVVAPPYDVISPEAQQRYYARHDYNVIRLILGQALPGDDEHRNRYTRAGELFRRWLAEGILIQDPIPCLYLYEQRFAHPKDGKERRRRGLIARVRLSPVEEGIVLPHEQTFQGPKEDRLRLMRACPANLDPVFAFYPSLLEPVQRLFEQAAEAPIDLTDEEGVRHRLWPLSDPGRISEVVKAFEGERLFIADGHHRYETALAFRDELSSADPAPPEVKAKRSYHYVMMTLVSAHDPGLVVLPTHRLLRTLPFPTVDPLLEEVRGSFQVEVREPSKGREAEAIRGLLEGMDRLGQERRVLGMYDGKGFYLLLFKGEGAFAGVGGRPPRTWWTDVALLQTLLIEGLLGLEEKPSEEQIAYTGDEVEAIRLVQEGRFRLAFFLNPPKLAEIQAVAEAKGRLPPKSTFFYPKLLSGLVFHRIDPDELIEPVI